MIAVEKTIKRENVFRGRILDVNVDTVELPDGSKASRELILHSGGVSVIPVDDEGYVYLVSQYRKPYEEEVLEIPAGKREAGEDPLLGAKRELSEETGLEADEFIPLGTIYPSPGYTSEVIYIYLARGLKEGEAHPDEGEYVNHHRIHLDELCDMVMSGEIKDAKTVAAVLKAKMYIDR